MATSAGGVTARVAVVPDGPGPLRIEEVDLPAPTGHQVLVREFASGICHSQLHQIHGPRKRPQVIGHEATGEVLAVGDQVDHVGVGDRVLLTFQPRNRNQTSRPPGAARVALGDGSDAVSPQIYTWATHTIADEQYVIPMAPDLPTDVTAVVGCAVLTGAGAALRAAAISAGDSVAIWGVGGVGLNTVAAARKLGANPIIAVDLDGAKLDLARRFGATHVVNAADEDPVEAVRRLTPGADDAYGYRGLPVQGVDVAFDVVATPESFVQAFRATRNGENTLRAGGMTVVVGVPQRDLALPGAEILMSERQVRGTIGGTSIPDEDIPAYLDWYRAGELDLDALITARIGLDEINEAVQMLDDGKVLGRSIIEFDD